MPKLVICAIPLPSKFAYDLRHNLIQGMGEDVTSTLIVSLVVAVAQNGVIGRDGAMPWRLSTDLKRFKALTLGKPVIMGRKTFESIGKPLANRLNIVVSRGPKAADGVEWVGSVPEAMDLASTWAHQHHVKEICIVGGGQIYKEALPLASRLHVTHVLAALEGDTHFPEILDADWLPTHTERVPAGEQDTVETLYVVYERKK